MTSEGHSSPSLFWLSVQREQRGKSKAFPPFRLPVTLGESLNVLEPVPSMQMFHTICSVNKQMEITLHVLRLKPISEKKLAVNCRASRG